MTLGQNKDGYYFHLTKQEFDLLMKQKPLIKITSNSEYRKAVFFLSFAGERRSYKNKVRERELK